MSYIQDKLETFEQFLMEKCPCHTNNSPEGFEKWLENLDIDELMDYAMDYRNQSLTDYHNHFIDKEHFEANMLDGEKVEDCGGAMLSAKNVWEYLKSLQDTNPKE